MCGGNSEVQDLGQVSNLNFSKLVLETSGEVDVRGCNGELLTSPGQACCDIVR